MTLVPLAFGQGNRGGTERQSSKPGSQAEELFQSALLLVGTKDWELARQRMKEATRLWMQVREPQKAARALLQVGDCYKQARMYSESLYCYKQALEVRPLQGSVKANAYNAIARVYVELYERDLAIDYFTKAIRRARRVKNITAQALALAGLADLHHRQGEREQARALLAQARKLNRQQGNPEAGAALLHKDGQISQEDGRLERAKRAFEGALAIYRKTGNVEGQVKVLCSMTNLFLLASKEQRALEQATQAVELAQKQPAVTSADKLRARELLWPAWLGRARAERAAGRKELAKNNYLQALSRVAGIWWLDKISTETSAIGFRQESQALYQEFVDLLVELGDFDEAYFWADTAKARALRGATEARPMMQPLRNSDQGAQLREMSQSIARLRTELLLSHLGTERRTKLQKEIRDAEYAREEKRVLAEMQNSRDRLNWSKPATVKWLQERMAQDKSVLLEFLLGETRSFAFLITPDGVSCEILPSQKEIEKAVRPYLEKLRTSPNHLQLDRELAKTREQAAALFSVLFGNLARQILPGQKLIVVPDGLLHYLPFETLIHDGHYLVEDHEISYNPSASMLSLWPASSSQTNDSKKMDLLAFGDPVFDPQSNARNFEKTVSDVDRLTPSMHSAQGYILPPLPRTRDEVQYIANLFPPDRRREYLGEESTEDALKRESLRDYKRLHFATHSLIDEVSPSRSAVVLTLDDDPQEDGVLEVSEISELDIDCDLVVLSACQTGRGKLFSGEGIVGLSRAFLRAGARSVVVSLWNVSDIATSRLMKDFYQQLVGDVGNAAALREAKLQMIGAKELKHPYYWASFVIIGKP
ncbi:MAG: CHAT domain-containing tetratricopeptide repeat protein [Acidobacteriota bacterium]